MIHRIDKKLIFLVFLFSLFINIMTAAGHLDPWDGIEAFLVTESMVLKGTAKLDPEVPTVADLNFDIRYTVYANKGLQTGKYENISTMELVPVYTVRSLLLSAISVPFYLLATSLSILPLVFVAMTVNPLLISLTVIVIFIFGTELLRSTKIGFTLCIIFAVCSFIWPYQNSLWAQPLQGLTLVLAAYFLYRSTHFKESFLCSHLIPVRHRIILYPLLAGLFLGLSLFAHPTSIVMFPGFIIYSIYEFIRRRKVLFYFLLTLAIMIIPIASLNFVRFGSVTEFGYGYYGAWGRHDGWKGLIGLLISPGAGLFVYFPLAVLLPLAGKYMYKEQKILFLLFLYIIIANWIDVGTLSFNFEPLGWWGTGWGPRYLVPTLPFITLILGWLLAHSNKVLALKVTIILLCIAGFYINLMGALMWWNYDIVYLASNGPQTDDQWNTIVWDPQASPIRIHTFAVLTGYLSGVDPKVYANTTWNFVTFGLAPCIYDLYIYCKMGIPPLLAISAIIAAISLLVLLMLYPTRSHIITSRLRMKHTLRKA